MNVTDDCKDYNDILSPNRTINENYIDIKIPTLS